MPDVDALVQRALALKVLATRVASEDKSAREALVAAMRPGSRWLTATPDGVDLGSVRYDKPTAARATVTDEAAFTQWVTDFYPSEVVVTRRVRDSFRKQLLDAVLSTGELPAGVEVGEPGKPRLVVEPLPDGAEDALIALLRADGLPMLEQNEGERE